MEFVTVSNFTKFMHALILNSAVRNSLVTELRIFFKCREQGYVEEAGYCLLKAIKADPKDVTF